MTQPGFESPVSFRVNVARLPQKGLPVRIEADETQRAALAREHGLLEVRNYRTDLVASPWKAGGVRIAGSVTADIVQECVVTLDPIDARVETDISALFVPEGSRLAAWPGSESEMVLDPDGPDAPETFRGDEIDVGALAEEFFVLAIDPYPRKAGAVAEALPSQDEEVRGPLAEKLAKFRAGPQKS